MSLDFDHSNVSRDVTFPLVTDPEEIAYYRKSKRRTVIDNGDDDFRVFSVKTEQLVCLTMSVGIGRITEKNWEKFYTRAYAWQRINSHDSDNIVKASDVYDHIGLRTNASSLTDSKFVKKLVRAIDSESESGIWLVKHDLNKKGE
jgi:hypothetical protein